MAFNNFGISDSITQIRDISDKLSPEVQRALDGLLNAPEIENLINIAEKEVLALLFVTALYMHLYARSRPFIFNFDLSPPPKSMKNVKYT